VPGMRELFGFGVVHADDLLVIGAAGLLALLWLEALRVTSRHTSRQSGLKRAG
jgi:hypothetical protein